MFRRLGPRKQWADPDLGGDAASEELVLKHLPLHGVPRHILGRTRLCGALRIALGRRQAVVAIQLAGRSISFVYVSI